MARLAIMRTVHILPGREADALQWLRDTAAVRRKAGQITQYVWRGIVDSSDYQFVQIWRSRAAYERWRETPERERLAAERARFMTHDPTRLYEVL